MIEGTKKFYFQREIIMEDKLILSQQHHYPLELEQNSKKTIDGSQVCMRYYHSIGIMESPFNAELGAIGNKFGRLANDPNWLEL